MGFSILWIYLFHARIWLPDTAMFAPLNTFKEIGYAGVDVFLFLSGFGLMTGMMKNNHDILTFYKKRMLRILPAYWIATSAALVCASVSGKQVADRTHALSSCQERASADWTLYFREHSVWGFASPMRASRDFFAYPTNWLQNMPLSKLVIGNPRRLIKPATAVVMSPWTFR